MDTHSLIIFLFVVAIGSYIQTVTGFALGLVIMGAVTFLGLAPVTFSAIVVSLLALVNSFLALTRQGHTVHWSSVRIIVAGMVPAVFSGLLLLDYLSAHSMYLLKTLLGVFIICSGLLLVYKPQPRATIASTGNFLAIGMIGGLFGGLFSTGGPPIVFHLYRQPLPVAVIRTTLLAIFVVATLLRITYVGINGDISWSVIRLSLYSLPLVILFTYLGRRFRPPLSDLSMRRLAFILLILLGLMLLLPSSLLGGA